MRKSDRLLDFFHFAPSPTPLPADLARSVEAAIRERRHIADTDAATLPAHAGNLSLHEWRPGQFCLRGEASGNVAGLLYALTYRVFRELAGNIFALTAHAARGGNSFVAVYFAPTIPVTLADLEQRIMRAS